MCDIATVIALVKKKHTEDKSSLQEDDWVILAPDLSLQHNRLIVRQRQKIWASYDAFQKDGTENCTDKELFKEQAMQLLTQKEGKKP